MQIDPKELAALRKDVIPLDAAAALAYERIYGNAHRSEHAFPNEHVRNVMAHALAVFGPLYTFNEDKTSFTELDEHTLRTGVFRDGATRLFFQDGRPELTRLAIRSGDLQKAIKVLVEIGLTFEDIPVPTELRPKP
jgi:hypothetical protein